MALHDLADPTAPLPSQLVLDSSLLLALRTGDDNPQAGVAHRFVNMLGARIADRQTVAWLLMPVLQECYHVVLGRSLRRSWATTPAENRLPNWLAAYKRHPEVLAAGFADLANFDEILAAFRSRRCGREIWTLRTCRGPWKNESAISSPFTGCCRRMP